MVAIPSSSPTLLSSVSIFTPSSSTTIPSHSNNNNKQVAAPSSPDSSCSSSPRFPCIDPSSGRTLPGHHNSFISSSNKMQRSSPSSSIPSPPEQSINYYNSSILVKGSHPNTLDHVFAPPRPKTFGPENNNSSSSDYYRRRIDHDNDASSFDHNNSHTNNPNNKNHSRIDIANLLCNSSTTTPSDGPTRNSNNTPLPPHTTNVNSNVHGHHHDPKTHALQQQHNQGLRAITEEADDHEDPSLHRHRHAPSYPDSRNGNHSTHYSNTGSHPNGTDSYLSSSQRVFAIDAPGAPPSTSYYRPPVSSSSSSSSHIGPRPASFSAGSSSSSGPLYSSGPSAPSSASVYTAAPSRSKLPGPQQRSASWNTTDRYQDYGHSHSSTSTSYEQEQEQQRRTDRSKSDYALHQQNYGPYLDSPPLSAAALPRSNGSAATTTPTTATTSSSTSSSTSTSAAPPSSSGGVKMAASGAEPSPSLYYQPQQPQPQTPSQHQQQQQTQHSQQPPSTPALSSSPSTYPYPSVSSNGGHGTPNSMRSLSNASMASSSSRSMRDYPHAQGSDNSANDQLRRPTLPPPAALLSGAEGKPQRIYGRDSTADDLWPPLPRPTRVVPIDAPNEKRPFQFNGSSMLPPVLPPPTSSAPSSSSSSSILPYPSGFSSGSMEQKPRRIYGIDAADVPARFPAPPPLPSSYGPNGSHYSKHQDISDEMESGESRKRVFGRDSSDYQQRPYGSSAATSPTSSAPSYGSSQPYGYNAPPPPQAPAPQSHHYASSDMDRSSRYDEYKHRGWSNGQSSSSSSSMGHGGPNYGSSSRPYSRAQSPTVDIKPPSWYQDYANSVPPKPQTQPAYQQRSDSGYYGGSGNSHHYQQQQQQHHHHSSSHGYGGSSSLAGIHEMDENEEGYHHHRSSTKSAGSKRSHKSGHGSSPSVHPFDTMDPSANSSKSKKPKRIKNAAGQEDMIVMDDEFYAVKAKRKRANASQLSVLNAAFERSYFPSTEERLRLSKQCRMCPRTVQIWFQNKRQSVKARSEAMEAAVSGTAITDELLEQRLQMLEEEQNLGGVDGQKRSTRDVADEDYEEDDESGPGELHGSDKSHRRHPHGGSGGVSSSKQRRSSGNNPGTNNGSSGTGLPTPSDAVMSALHIQLDGRSVDYFSRKRRATIAKMERNEQQKKEKEELQRKREQEQQLIIQQYQKHQQEQVQKQRLQQQQQEGQTVGQN